MSTLGRLDVIGRTYRHLARYRQIVGVFFKYGFGDLVEALRVRRYLEAVLRVLPGHEPHERLDTLSRPERVRLALEELGPTFVKLGQVLSVRVDLIPPEYVEELAKLQDRVPSFPYEQVREIIRAELGGVPEEVFREFDPVPVGSASIAQGHRAILKDGTEVFVKVRRPNIRRIVEVDLEIMMHLASVIEQHIGEARVFRPTRIVREFSRSLDRETSFEYEAGHLERFARQFEGREGVRVPAIFRELSGESVLTMEFIRGIKATNLAELTASGCDLKRLAARGAELLLEQFFVHGFFHADPHPGNIYILPDETFCYVDFGMMGRISRAERECFADLMTAVLRREERRAIPPILALTFCESEPDREELERDIGDLLDRHLYLPLSEIRVGVLLSELHSASFRHGLGLKPHIYMMVKALGTVEDLGRRLDPDFRLPDHLKPFVRRLTIARYHPGRMARDVYSGTVDALQALQSLPEQVRTLMRQITDGRAKIEFVHQGLDRMISSHEHISNRIASAIVLASLIVGSSLMTLSEVPPKWNGMPIIGLGGFLVAAILGFGLLWDIYRSGRR